MNYKNSIRCTFIVIISLVINNIFIDNCESSTQTKNVLLEKVKSAYTNKDVELLYKVTYFSGNDDVAVKKRIGNDFSKHILFPIKSIEIVPLNSELLRHLKNMRMMLYIKPIAQINITFGDLPKDETDKILKKNFMFTAPKLITYFIGEKNSKFYIVPPELVEERPDIILIEKP